jgi:glycine/D-amino acid oxidase-like deaminating enzyme
MRHQFDADLPYPDAYRMLDREEVARLIPAIGPKVVGASYCRLDGCANSLRLLRALHVACQRLGGRYLPGIDVGAVKSSQSGFALETASGAVCAERVVLAAGLGNPASPIRGAGHTSETDARSDPGYRKPRRF